MARVGDREVATRFHVPSGRAGDVLARLDREALGLARARVAAKLGLPDPFHLREALAADPDARVEGQDGEPLDADAANAALVAAGEVPELHGLFAWAPPGPKVRALPVAREALRWPRTDPPPAQVGRVETWTTAEIGDADVATVRCALAVPGGVALGSDYGLTLRRRGVFEPFPWPGGARREARRVECMALHEGRLVVGTTQTLYAWDLRERVTSEKYGADDEGGYDELACVLSTGDRLYRGFRTGLHGGVGPRDALSLAADPAGVVFAGTRKGELHVVDGGLLRAFGPRPVRHLAWADGRLWVAADGACHTFDGVAWSRVEPEPTAFAVDPRGRLWALAEGRLHVGEGAALREVPVALERPWCLAATGRELWIGGKGRVWCVEI
ncbi:MAG: hypothetical protein ACOZNI_23930 [Myxococcota bacterium]